MADGIKLGKITLALLDRMVARGLVLVRQTADTATAMKQGGYVYFTHPDGKPVRSDPARQLIRLGIIVSRRDDLFAGADGGGKRMRSLIVFRSLFGLSLASVESR